MGISDEARRPVAWPGLLLFWLAVSLMLWLNMTRQETDYGTGGGRFADQVDSFSEYLIRNSVVDRVRTGDPAPGYLVRTKGYDAGDYSYYPEATSRYYSNRGIQADVFASIGSIDRRFFLDHSAAFFGMFRFLNSSALAACIIIFFTSLYGRTYLSLGLALLLTLSGGVALFASNLYFTAWLLFAPLACHPLVKREKYGCYCGAAFLLSLIYFSVRYEFATTFALMWLLPFLAEPLSGRAIRRRYAAFAFLCACLGFGVALLWHHFSVADANRIALAEASKLIFVTIETRMASLEGVPAPLSFGFFKSLVKRWDWTGFSLPLILSISKLSVILVFLYLCHRHRRSGRLMMTMAWALITYVSWYVFSYQHIMLHIAYDSLIFAATVQLTVVMMIGMALRDGLAERLWGRRPARPADGRMA